MQVSKGLSAVIIVIVLIVIGVIGYTMFLKPKSTAPSEDVRKMYEQRGLSGIGGGSPMGATTPGGSMSGGSAMGGSAPAGAPGGTAGAPGPATGK